MSNTVIIAPSAAIANTIEADVTVEAEYGSVVAKGSVYTAAHHQPGMENLPAPCVDENIPTLDEATVLVSHLDLDTIGGVLRVFGSPVMDKAPSFWKLAAFGDTNGPHRLGESGASEFDIDRLYAFWAWKKANIAPFSRDEATIITGTIVDSEAAIAEIIDGHPDMLTDGRIMRQDEDALNRSTFVEAIGEVITRVTSSDPKDGQGFCNHLYTAPDGKVYKGVVAYDKHSGSITMSLAEDTQGVSCRDVMQEMFGPEAGGHNCIAGSPREEKLNMRNALNASSRLAMLLVG